MTNHVLAGLITRRAELAGEAEALRACLAEVLSGLEHLDAVIGHFDPTYKVSSIRSKRPRVVEAVNLGERSRLVLDIMRRAGEPIAAREIVRQVLLSTAQEDADQLTRLRITRRTEAVLARQERRGVVRALRGVGQFVLWEIAR